MNIFKKKKTETPKNNIQLDDGLNNQQKNGAQEEEMTIGLLCQFCGHFIPTRILQTIRSPAFLSKVPNWKHTKMILCKWLALLIGMTTVKVECFSATQNEEIKGQTGIYFDFVADVWFTPHFWDVITYVDVGPVQHLYDTLKQGSVTIQNECKNLLVYTWYHKTDCEQGLAHILAKRTSVQRLRETLEEIIGPMVNNDNNRKKCSVLGFVGEISKILFGTATEAEIECIRKEWIRCSKNNLISYTLVQNS
ncbi:uncharacterized protein [Periplaneta americana]|uniref:uncharacterized protein isoform X1 n=1 Tax=Periplaneta americana TaxID=6978 RepID=UPI0037E795F2